MESNFFTISFLFIFEFLWLGTTESSVLTNENWPLTNLRALKIMYRAPFGQSFNLPLLDRAVLYYSTFPTKEEDKWGELLLMSCNSRALIHTSLSWLSDWRKAYLWCDFKSSRDTVCLFHSFLCEVWWCHNYLNSLLFLQWLII